VHDQASKKAVAAIRRIEGQVRGIGKMIEENRYCIDIVTQIEAARAALARVEADLLKRHLQHCVHQAMTSDDEAAREKVIDELVGVFKR
jgi:DNA-binding FrmR family transcriptional regulator